MIEKSMLFLENVAFSPEAKEQYFLGIVGGKVVATSVIIYGPNAAALFGSPFLMDSAEGGLDRL